MGNIRGGMNGFLGTMGQPTAQVIDGSLKFKGGQYLQRTSTAGNQTTWTWSGWIKVSDLSGNNIFGEDGGYPNASASFNTSGVLRFTAAAADSSVFLNVIPSAQFRDFSAWYHFVIVYDSGNTSSSERARIYVNGSRITDLSTATYPSQNATTVVNSNGNAFRIGSHSGVDHLQGYMSQCYFIDGLVLGPGYFGFTDPLTNTWRPKKFRAEGTTVNDGRTWSNNSTGTFDSGYPKTNAFNGNISNGTYAASGTTASFTFSNIKITQTNRLRVYGNSGFSNEHSITSGGVSKTWNNETLGWHDLTDLFPTPWSFDQYTVTVNGSLRVIEFGGIVLRDGVTQNLSFGTNGFYLPMDDEDRFRLDQSGNNNHFTEAGWSGTSIDPDVVKDSPSGAVFGNPPTSGITTTSSAPTNYCTWNPLSGQNIDLQDGSLDAESGTISSYATIPSTMAMTNGKYYAEFTYRENIDGDGDGSNFFRFGISQTDRNFESGSDPLGTSKDFGWQGAGTLRARTNGSNSYTYTGNTIADGDILSLAFDADAGKLWIARNGTWATNSGGTGDPANGNNPDFSSLTYSGGYFFVAGPYAGAQSPANGGGRLSAGLVGNWGQKPFKYVPPKGFLPLNSATVRPNKVVPRSDQYVGVATYTGSGNTSQDIIFGFKPDFAWTKSRSTAENHGLFDSVRGLPKFLRSDSTDNEYTLAAGTPVSFISNGINFTNGSGEINESTRNYVAWAWKAGGNKNTFNVDDVGYASAAAAGLDGGTLTPTGASVGAKQGFSIVGFTGPGSTGTYSHGLSQKPDFMIFKNRDDDSSSWLIYHSALGATKYISFTTAAAVTSNNPFNDTEPTSSVFTAGNWLDNSSTKYIGYIWHDISGLQKFGTFTGNGNADGPYVELGFRPALLWVKRTDSTGNWVILDTKRNPFNPADTSLYADTTEVDYTPGQDWADLLSNGFKIRATYGEVNASSGNYIYCAWAEAPASNLFGGQSNAR